MSRSNDFNRSYLSAGEVNELLDDLVEAKAEAERLRKGEELTFRRFSEANRMRCKHGFGHELGDWSASDWMTATLGELGEAANVIKKLNRERDGIIGNTVSIDVLRGQLADELADTFIYLDLMFQALGIDMAEAVIRKFDATSQKIGWPARLQSMSAEKGQSQ